MDVLRKRRSDGKRATAHRYLIRPAQPADLEDVREIERVVFSDPWSANDFAQCLTSGVPFLISEQQGIVAGYLVAHGAADEGEILNLGVAPAHRRRGVGRALVERALTLLAARGARAVFLEVRESNAAARRLYQSLGFLEVARRARYYRRPVEDAVVLRAVIPGDGVLAKL
jgi:[ribosomal protein S18]-alanine N-acetyltransferase